MFKCSVIAVFLLGACVSDGNDGAPGAPGMNGTNGTNGTNGSDGAPGPDGPAGPELAPPGVYTLANAAAGNRVAAYLRGENGNLTRDNEFDTGGAGLGVGLHSQDGMVFDKASQRFFAVNAGDNTISMLAIDSDGVLTKIASVPSGGTRPISIAVHGDAVYVLNYGDVANPAAVNGNITGFKIVGDSLVAIAGSTQPLSAATDVNPTDLAFTPDGTVLVVAELATNKLDAFAVTADVAAPGNFQASSGSKPFSMAFSPEGFLLVSEVGDGTATGSTARSYSVSPHGVLTAVTSRLATNHGAGCCIVSAGGFAYVANAASATITGLTVSTTGVLSQPTTTPTGPGALDLAVSPDRGYLYSLASGDHTIRIFDINSDGTLTAEPKLSGMPPAASGLVAR
jgi:6-phosphogluconolactonase (cycloisomerase 2 family)